MALQERSNSSIASEGLLIIGRLYEEQEAEGKHSAYSVTAMRGGRNRETEYSAKRKAGISPVVHKELPRKQKEWHPNYKVE